MRTISKLIITSITLGLLCMSTVSLAQPPGGGGAPNFSEAAEKLGISEDQLIDALGDDRPPNFAEAAEKLGITEEKLQEVLPAPPEGGRPQR